MSDSIAAPAPDAAADNATTDNAAADSAAGPDVVAAGSGDASGALVFAEFHTPVEVRLVRAWVAENVHVDGHIRVLTLPRRGGPSREADRIADAIAQASPGTLLMPVHVTWLPAEHENGTRPIRVRDLVRLHNPYRPPSRAQAGIARREPDRARVVAGTPATLATLRERFAETHSGAEATPESFSRFVIRRAHLSLERADGRVLGPQFKAPKLVADEILAQSRFRAGVAELATEIGPDKANLESAEEILNELATGWGRASVDLVPRLQRKVFERGFDKDVDVIPEELERLRATTSTKPVIFLWSHRSNLDSGVFLVTLHENGFPLPHLFAGINMAFGPMGPVLRRAGFIFIRRAFGDDALYKYVLREFIGYLSEKRFNLSWSIEGTRSRTGKMLPPKLGLLSYSADAYLQGRTDDVALQPVSISFDQLHEITEYADYARGGKKAAEGFSWLYNFVKAQGARQYGKVYVRFPEPVSMREMLGPPNGPIATDEAAHRLALQKMAFEVAWRINEAMPVTPTALVTTVLLGAQGVGLTSEQILNGIQGTLRYFERRKVPRAASMASLTTIAGVEKTLRALSTGDGPVTRVDGARDVVWLIEKDDQLRATFYRNSLIHTVLLKSICEIALVLAARTAPPGPARVDAFWASTERLRDLLKFEFYFKDRAEFRRLIGAEMDLGEGDWRVQIAAPEADLHQILSERRPLTAAFTLRPFFEAYEIVADVLAHHDEAGPLDRGAIKKEALALGDQFLAQQRISSAEPVSALLFETALQLADNQGVLAEGPDRLERATAFRAELLEILGALDLVQRVTREVFIETVFPERLGAARRERPTGAP